MPIVFTKLSHPTCKGASIFKYSRVTWRRHSQPGTARCNGCCLHSRIVLVQLQWSMTDKLLLMLPVGSFKCYQNTHGGWGLYYLVKEAEEGHAQVAHELISRCEVDDQDNVKTSFTLPATNSTSSALTHWGLPTLKGYHLSWQKKSDKFEAVFMEGQTLHGSIRKKYKHQEEI